MSAPDVIVVGAGIVGAAAALALAEAGASVEVLERYRPGAMASGWTLAGVRQSGRDPAELPLARAAVEAWATLDERLGAPTGYRRGGNLRLARTPAEVPVIEALVADQSARGLAIERVEGARLREIAPGLSPDLALASWCPSDGHADPEATVAAFRAAGERRGVRYRCGVPALGIAHRAGRVTGVRTAEGVRAAGACLLAAGVQTGDLLASLGPSLPIEVAVVAALQTAPMAASLGPVIGVAGADLAIRQQADGRYRFTGGAEPRPPDLREEDGMPVVSPCAGSVAEVIARAVAVLPALAEAPLARIWGGLIDMTPDALPVLDRAPGVDGLLVAAGFSGHGFGIAPAVGPALADLALGAGDAFDLSPFRFDRFAGAPVAAPSPALHG